MTAEQLPRFAKLLMKIDIQLGHVVMRKGDERVMGWEDGVLEPPGIKHVEEEDRQDPCRSDFNRAAPQRRNQHI